MVLKKVPNARLVIGGANHHTTPGYWESIREAHKSNSRINFLGYVPRDGIPELFATASVLVMPYDSATGSSGPAHQACEYGLPIVSADIPDFKVMAADEEMAISFYKTGDAADLADRLVDLLQSPERQREMAEQNFSAAVRMTMPAVVRNYMRWFELAKRKRAMGPFLEPSFLQWRRLRPGSAFRHASWDGSQSAEHTANDHVSKDGNANGKGRDGLTDHGIAWQPEPTDFRTQADPDEGRRRRHG